jgi:acetylornithine deacetylase/succinyl-diaminopimelate desuccinylase-like protein
MKGGLVSMLYGAAAARDLGLLDGRRIVSHFVGDAETGSTTGSGHLREAGLIDPGALVMLTAEPTGGVIWHACSGAITLRVRTFGREAHVGYVHEGVNAFEP